MEVDEQKDEQEGNVTPQRISTEGAKGKESGAGDESEAQEESEAEEGEEEEEDEEEEEYALYIMSLPYSLTSNPSGSFKKT